MGPGANSRIARERGTYSQTSSNIPERKKEDAMLVLSRKLNERIVIDGGIVLTVVKIDRNQVRLGIEAPPHVRVFREEIAGSTFRAPVAEAVGAGV
jgi:carbon storage regulator